MNRDADRDFIDIGRQLVQFDDDTFIVAIALAGPVITGMGDAAIA